MKHKVGECSLYLMLKKEIIFEHKEKDVKGLKRTHRAGEHYPNSGFPFSKICPNKTQ